MARYSLSAQSVTTTSGGAADAANLTDGAYPFFLQGGSSTMRLAVNEVQAGGEATAASAVQILVLGRDSTVAATGISGAKNALMDGSSVAPGTLAVYGNTSTTKPQRSLTLGHLLQHSFNAYGGLVRWQARQGEEITVVGNTASLGEISYSAFTGNVAGAISAHLIYEVI